MRYKTLVVVVALLMSAAAPTASSASTTAGTSETTAGTYEGSLANGTTWVAEVPDDWNGTVLLYSHGYLPSFIGAPNLPASAPDPGTAAALLDRGYALVGSSYTAAGWALPTAPDDQLDSLAAAIDAIGHAPDRVLAYGSSMGGLVTAKIVETDGGVIDGALPTCGIVDGGLTLNNYQLDGAHAIDTLLAPETEIQLADFASVADSFVSTQQLVGAVQAAQDTPEGRARIALAATLFKLPTRAAGGELPAARDWDAMEQNQFEWLVTTLPFVVPARTDIEAAVGGNASWNAGVDYRALFRHAADRKEVAALYRTAGLDLGADLDRLSDTADVVADGDAIDAIVDTSVPTGEIGIPVLTLHTVADNLVPVQHEAGYAERVRRAGAKHYLRQAFVDRVGHCAFTTAEMVAAVEALDSRVETGRWGRITTPAALQVAAESSGLGDAAFVRRPADIRDLDDRADAVVGP
jgi:alpha-beta hydrolase superfamily lysophospholipase